MNYVVTRESKESGRNEEGNHTNALLGIFRIDKHMGTVCIYQHSSIGGESEVIKFQQAIIGRAVKKLWDQNTPRNCTIDVWYQDQGKTLKLEQVSCSGLYRHKRLLSDIPSLCFFDLIGLAIDGADQLKRLGC